MAALPAVLDAGRALWAAVVGSSAVRPACGSDELRAAAARFAHLVGPVTADWLLASATESAMPLVSPDLVSRSLQFNRFNRAIALKWLGLISDAGLEVAVLKGFATAHRFYPDPVLRTMSDVDILVRPRDIDRLCRALGQEGFRFLKSKGTPSWGLSSESSFHPFVSADGAFIFDLHVAADDFPVSRGLEIEEVFAQAAIIEIEGVRVPRDDHLVLLAATNAGRDKFGPGSMTSMTDLVVALGRMGVVPDWNAIVCHAGRGGFLRPLTAAVRLLARLGVDRGRLPVNLLGRYRGPAALAFEGIVADYLSMFVEEPSPLLSQRRDWLVISGIRALAHRNWRRVRGLVRPWTGLPPGHRLGGP